jgi:hypothetical protein
MNTGYLLSSLYIPVMYVYFFTVFLVPEKDGKNSKETSIINSWRAVFSIADIKFHPEVGLMPLF